MQRPSHCPLSFALLLKRNTCTCLDLQKAGMTGGSAAPKPVSSTSLEERMKAVQQHFPTALPVE
eukprot:scaffold223169_cov13-Tisochrysis_lutea.AAC.1